MILVPDLISYLGATTSQRDSGLRKRPLASCCVQSRKRVFSCSLSRESDRTMNPHTREGKGDCFFLLFSILFRGKSRAAICDYRRTRLCHFVRCRLQDSSLENIASVRERAFVTCARTPRAQALDILVDGVLPFLRAYRSVEKST